MMEFWINGLLDLFLIPLLLAPTTQFLEPAHEDWLYQYIT
jgi:hypothetical protein